MDELGNLLESDLAGAAPEDEKQAVNHVRLAAPVGTHDRRKALNAEYEGVLGAAMVQT